MIAARTMAIWFDLAALPFGLYCFNDEEHYRH